jgi:IS5 family transposase
VRITRLEQDATQLRDWLATQDSLLTADAGYHSEANLKALEDRQVAALIADGEMRRRDERFATVEPMFAILRDDTGLDRFTPRGRAKVDGQWKPFCLVQNIRRALGCCSDSSSGRHARISPAAAAGDPGVHGQS